MEGLLRNYWMNMKRICRLMPVIITGTVLLCLCVLLGAYVFTRNNASDHTRIKIGVVGNIDNSYLEYGITALQSMDTTRYIVELVTVNEDEAAAMIRAGELTAYMVIPEGFVDSVMYGRNNVQVEYVCGEGKCLDSEKPLFPLIDGTKGNSVYDKQNQTNRQAFY